jgi:hypothetical protein
MAAGAQGIDNEPFVLGWEEFHVIDRVHARSQKGMERCRAIRKRMRDFIRATSRTLKPSQGDPGSVTIRQNDMSTSDWRGETPAAPAALVLEEHGEES